MNLGILTARLLELLTKDVLRRRLFVSQSDTSKVITRQRLARLGEQLDLEMVGEFWFPSEKCC